MTELLTAAQMRAIEQAAIDSGEVTGLELMECAGQGVVEAILEEWPELAKTSHRAVVLCGPGNNGGDGFVVARLLKDRGWEVEVFLFGDPEKLPPDAKVNYERWLSLGLSVVDLRHGFSNLKDDEGNLPALIVDAVFGTGLKRRIEEPLQSELSQWAYSPGDPETHLVQPPKIVSVDFPSGICSDSGVWFDAAPVAHLTVTFHTAKTGHFLGDGPAFCGSVRTKPIGLKGDATINSVKMTCGACALPSSSPYEGFAWLGKEHSASRHLGPHHKFSHGHALIMAGGPGKGGAGRLAARGALRIGAGLVTLACPPAALQENAARLDAIMVRSMKAAPALTEALEDDRLNALCLGPGLGVGQTTCDLVAAALSAQRATVLDADALTSFEDDPQALFDQLHPNCVLTPHGGEFKRLFPDIAEELAAPATTGPAYSKVDAARETAQRAGCTILFKGPDTVIADAGGRASINSAHYDRSAPWLATAGSGDVLAGFITGLLARGFSPHDAAATAAWLHVECALSFGPGLIAEDLPEALPKVFSALGA